MYGLAVNLIVSVSGHPWIIDEMKKVLLPGDFSSKMHLCAVHSRFPFV